MSLEMEFELFQGFKKKVSLFYHDVTLCTNRGSRWPNAVAPCTHTKKIYLLKQIWKLT